MKRGKFENEPNMSRGRNNRFRSFGYEIWAEGVVVEYGLPARVQIQILGSRSFTSGDSAPLCIRLTPENARILHEALGEVLKEET